MSGNEILLNRQELQRLLAAKDGDAALIYLYMQTGAPLTAAALTLDIPVQRVDRAIALLRQLDIIQEQHRFVRGEDRPVFTEEDVVRAMEGETGFRSLLSDVEHKLGHMLNMEDLKSLLNIRDYLGLPDQVISLLVTFCMERNRARGNVKAPAMRSIEKEAYSWADNDINTVEAAIAFMKQQNDHQEKLGTIRRNLQIFDRRLTPSEEKYILKWLENGFGEREIALAYDRTCLRTGKMNWKYMDSILNSWQEHGLFTLEQIEQSDKAPEYRRPAAGNPGTEIDEMALKAMELRRKQKENR